MSELKHLSWSSLQTYSDCGEKYRLQKIAFAPQSPSWSQLAGNAVHEVLENLAYQDFGMPFEGPLTFREAFEAKIAEKEAEEGCPPQSEWHRAGRVSKANPNKEDRTWWENNGQIQVDNWRNWLQRSPFQVWITPEGIPAIELNFTVPFGDVPVRGFVDTILEDAAGVLIVVDYKTGSRKPSGVGQLATYSQALSDAMGYEHNPFRFGSYFMTREGMSTPPLPLANELDGRLNFQYAQAWKGIKEGIFLPHVGNMCGSCSVRNSCVYYSGTVAEEFLPYRKDAA